MDRPTYRRLLAAARRHTARADEAEDLVQSALLIALESGRSDLAAPETGRWLAGVLRNRARHEARSALRRRRREADHARLGPDRCETAEPEGLRATLDTLPRGLRLAGLLALSGHSRAEIAAILGLGDAALRQRLMQLRRRLPQGAAPAEPALPAGMPLGAMRRALLPQVRRVAAGGGPDGGRVLGSHDPDGYLFVLTSHSGPARQHRVSET